MKVLFVCMGNTCRSPMLRCMFEDYLLRRGILDISVDCAGLLNGGQAISADTVKVLKACGVACDENYLSKYCDKDLALEADFIICVADECKEILKKQYPSIRDIVSLFELCGESVNDPYEQGIDEYFKAYKTFEKALPKILEYIYRTN